jgi:hypothetical protein
MILPNKVEILCCVCNMSVDASSPVSEVYRYVINIKLLNSVLNMRWEPTSSYQMSHSSRRAQSILDNVIRTNLIHSLT